MEVQLVWLKSQHVAHGAAREAMQAQVTEYFIIQYIATIKRTTNNRAAKYTITILLTHTRGTHLCHRTSGEWSGSTVYLRLARALTALRG